MPDPDRQPLPDYAIDELAEDQVLGMVISAPDICHETFDKLHAVAAWTNERRLIAATIAALYQAQEPIDPAIVSRAVIARAGTDDDAHRTSMRVFTLYEAAPPTANPGVLDYWAERAHRVGRGRTAMVAAILLRQRIDQALRNDDSVGYDRALTEAGAALETAAVGLASAAAPPKNFAGLMAVPTGHDWLIPGLFERGDRLILTGFEGLGKSELLIQMGLTSAAGLHMFSGRPLSLGGGRPVTVLIVDVENSERQLARRNAKVAGQVERLCDRHGIRRPDWHNPDDGAIRYVIRPDGIPLSDPRELARLERSIAATAPDLVIAGPHYKLADRDMNDEQEAKEITKRLDILRVRYGFALILEAHSPHAVNGKNRELRPIGSSLFRRWSEFGYGLRPAEGTEDEDRPSAVKFERWRGDRDRRAWPTGLVMSTSLPWLPYDESYSDWLNNDGEQVA